MELGGEGEKEKTQQALRFAGRGQGKRSQWGRVKGPRPPGKSHPGDTRPPAWEKPPEKCHKALGKKGPGETREQVGSGSLLPLSPQLTPHRQRGAYKAEKEIYSF